LLLTGLFCIPAARADFTEDWNWYYSRFSFGNLGAKASIRWGVAQVREAGQEIQIKFHEPALNDDMGVFTGTLDAKGYIKGKLAQNFTDGGPLDVRGSLREREARCPNKSIVLETGTVTGDVIFVQEPICKSSDQFRDADGTFDAWYYNAALSA
jgi:hypothetical protein